MSFAMMLSSCGGETDDKSSDKKATFDERVTEVCDCFSKAKEESTSPEECFMNQSKYGKEFKGREKEFNVATSDCK